jgi:hypothetical protein
LIDRRVEASHNEDYAIKIRAEDEDILPSARQEKE